MYTIKNYAYLALLMLLPTVMTSQNEDWQQELENPESNFFDITQKYREKLESSNKVVRIKSNSGNVKIEGENDFIRFRRWEYLMSSELNPDGSLPSDRTIQNSYKEFDNLSKNTIQLKSANSNWRNISRTSNSGGYWGMGRTNDIAYHPSNPNIFWVSAAGGGIWKTTNGGKSYVPQGDQLPYLGSGAIAVDPKNPNTIYTATGNNVGGFGMGIYKSTDGGNSWSATGYTTRLDEKVKYNELLVHPNNSNILLIATSRGIFRSTNGGNSWDRIINGNATDVTFRINSNNTLYAVVNSTLHRSTNSGASFSVVANAPKLARDGKISVTKANANKLVLWSRTEIFTSENSGNNWNKKERIRKAGDKIMTHWSLVISPSNANTLYVGEVDIHRSTNNGSSWTRISAWAGHVVTPNAPEVHADHRMLSYNPINNRIYSCNDGGIDRYTESSKKWDRLSNGLVIAQYYSAASSEQNSEFLVAGSQDNGGAVRRKNGTWGNTNGGDAGTQAVDPINDKFCYSNYNPNPAIIKSSNGWGAGGRTNVKPAEATASWWQLPFVLQPNQPSNIIVGYHAVFRSTNRGGSWSKISPDLSNKLYFQVIRAIAVAPSDGNVIYAYTPRYYDDATKKTVPAKFHYTYNAKNWNSTQFQHNITSITVDPKNSRIVYVSCGDYSNGNKVFKSTDGGKSFTNISSGIPNIPIYDVEIQRNSNEVLYVGTSFGVFYKNASMSSWKIYGNGLPRTRISDLHINYNKKKLRAATYGRGVYEIDIQGNNNNPITCIAPANVRITSVTNNSINLDWNDLKGAKQYYLYHKRRNSEDKWKITRLDELQSNGTIRGLLANTAYLIDVWVQCANDEYKSTRIEAKTNAAGDGFSIVSGGIYEIASTNPGGRLLEVFGAAKRNESNVVLWSNYGSESQQWILYKENNDYYRIVPRHDQTRSLDVHRGQDANGTNVQTFRSHSGHPQQWRFINLEKNIFRIKPRVAPNSSLDLSGNRNVNGTNIRIWEDNNSNAHKWILRFVGNSSSKEYAPPVSQTATKVFPNPVNEGFTINFDTEALSTSKIILSMTDMLGKNVMQIDKNISDLRSLGSLQVNTSSFQPGIYILTVKNGNGELIHQDKLTIKR